MQQQYRRQQQVLSCIKNHHLFALCNCTNLPVSEYLNAMMMIVLICVVAAAEFVIVAAVRLFDC